MYIVFDLDGTLADITHRLHHIQGERKDWPAFFAACINDAPVLPLVSIYQDLWGDGCINRIEIWSGRSDEVRQQTVGWLGQHKIPYDALRMRKAGDHQPDDKLKAGWFDSLPNGWRPALAFDDRQRIVDMWRSRGVICCQVAPGDF